MEDWTWACTKHEATKIQKNNSNNEQHKNESKNRHSISEDDDD